jgi:hypothetical protein
MGSVGLRATTKVPLSCRRETTERQQARCVNGTAHGWFMAGIRFQARQRL